MMTTVWIVLGGAFMALLGFAFGAFLLDRIITYCLTGGRG
jgi:hypothetical protein